MHCTFFDVLQVGKPADLSFSVYYAPPEVLRAYKAGEKKILADPSADVWALGVRFLHSCVSRCCCSAVQTC